MALSRTSPVGVPKGQGSLKPPTRLPLWARLPTGSPHRRAINRDDCLVDAVGISRLRQQLLKQTWNFRRAPSRFFWMARLRGLRSGDHRLCLRIHAWTASQSKRTYFPRGTMGNGSASRSRARFRLFSRIQEVGTFSLSASCAAFRSTLIGVSTTAAISVLWVDFTGFNFPVFHAKPMQTRSQLIETGTVILERLVS